jgi:hypothetical protein
MGLAGAIACGTPKDLDLRILNKVPLSWVQIVDDRREGGISIEKGSLLIECEETARILTVEQPH